ncbi:MAG: rhodanese-like domain-containing protein [Pseudomonadota bacterium]|nr:rhodanese-like domain-containing protein [Pseudomonadota bacterium]
MMLTRLFASALFLFALGGCAEPPYTNVDNAQLKTLLAQGVPIYDVRRPEEWRQTGVVAGSRKLTFVDAGSRPQSDFFPAITREVRRDQPVIVICRTGNRTDSLARELMEKMGYTQVYNVQNGIAGWIGEGNPVVRN